MSGLSDYINSLNRDGWSLRRISQEAEKHGHKVDHTTVRKYVNGEHGKPSPEVLEALAAAFGVTTNEMRAAAGRPGVGEKFDLGAEASRLTGPQRDTVRRVVQQFVEANDALAGHPVDDGSSEVRQRVRSYLDQHLVTHERWPDFPLLPVSKREEIMDAFVDYGTELIQTGLASEAMALPHVAEQAASLIRKAMAELEQVTRSTDTQQHEPAPIPPVDVADPSQPDGPTTAGPTDTDIGPKVHHLDRTSTNGEPYPWEQPDFDLAAKRGRNRGREAREQQDRDAEDGGA